MAARRVAGIERIVMSRSAEGFESRPRNADQDHSTLAAALEAFRRLTTPVGRLDFVYSATPSLTYRVTVERSDAESSFAWLTAEESVIPLGLSPRELDVMTLMCLGLSYVEIASSTHVTQRTVTTHVEHIFAKLGVTTRTDGVVKALEAGAVRLPLPAEAPNHGSLLARIDSEMRTIKQGAWRRTLRAAMPPPSRRSNRAVQIGCLYPLDQLEGQDMLLGARLAMDEINAAGGVRDRPVELTALGVDVSSLESIRDGTATMIDSNIDALVFGYADTRDSVPVLLSDWSEAGMPVLHSLTSRQADEIVASGHGRYHNVFQVCPSDNFYGDEFLRFVRKAEGASSRASTQGRILMVTDDPQMVGYFPAWSKQARRLSYSLDLIKAADVVSAQQAALQACDEAPAAVFLACFRPTTLRSFLRAFLVRPSASLLYALWSPGTSDFRDDLKDFEGLVWSTSTGRYDDALGKQFEHRFQSRFSRGAFGTSASIQYDSVSLLAHAWRRSGHSASYGTTTKELRSLVHRGVNGSYFFGTDSQRSLAYGSESRDASLSQAHLIYQIQNGVNRIISPSPYAVSRFRPQPWQLAQ